MTEIKITLHTAGGDVVTTYTKAQLQYALNAIAQYVADDKPFTVVYF